ncbi:hypothetical protein K8R66_03225 [bacterium]|nr:hypothetical protein [bacterium]
MWARIFGGKMNTLQTNVIKKIGEFHANLNFKKNIETQDSSNLGILDVYTKAGAIEGYIQTMNGLFQGTFTIDINNKSYVIDGHITFYSEKMKNIGMAILKNIELICRHLRINTNDFKINFLISQKINFL